MNMIVEWLSSGEWLCLIMIIYANQTDPTSTRNKHSSAIEAKRNWGNSRRGTKWGNCRWTESSSVMGAVAMTFPPLLYLLISGILSLSGSPASYQDPVPGISSKNIPFNRLSYTPFRVVTLRQLCRSYHQYTENGDTSTVYEKRKSEGREIDSLTVVQVCWGIWIQ